MSTLKRMMNSSKEEDPTACRASLKADTTSGPPNKDIHMLGGSEMDSWGHCTC